MIIIRQDPPHRKCAGISRFVELLFGKIGIVDQIDGDDPRAFLQLRQRVDDGFDGGDGGALVRGFADRGDHDRRNGDGAVFDLKFNIAVLVDLAVDDGIKSPDIFVLVFEPIAVAEVLLEKLLKVRQPFVVLLGGVLIARDRIGGFR